MIKWFIDKNSKIPLYLQLKDLIKFYISTGSIRDRQKLPGVVHLAEELGINFDTVRKAYKELEKEKLISMKRGKGSYATVHRDMMKKIRPGSSLESEFHLDPIDEVKLGIKRLLQSGKNLEEVKRIIDQALNEAVLERSEKFVIFTECNRLQVKEISKLLKESLNLRIKPVLLNELRGELRKIAGNQDQLIAIITTGFHMNEVYNIAGETPVDVFLLITSMSPETRRKLNTFDKNTRFGFICRDSGSIALYKDLLRSEISEELNISCCIWSDEPAVEAMLNTVDVLLVTPPVYKDVKRKAARKVPVINVFDWVEPMSLKMVQNNINWKLSSSF